MRCKTCGTTSSRPSAFDDVNLAIRTFDAAQTPIRSLAAAIEAFIEPETLEGDNAYHCEHCASKQPALKGLRFTMLPPVLCLGLKRFDFDFAELRRVKLHHSVAVPAMLSASTFLEDRAVRQAKRKLAGDNFEADSGEGGSSTDAVSSPEPEVSLECNDGAAGGDISSGEGGLTEGGAGDDGEPASGEAAGGQAASGKAASAVASGEADSGEGGNSTSSAADQYELFSMLMHSGSALAGHYFCFIKDLSSGTWYKFNDSSVSLATDSQLQAAMGATENGSAGSTYMVFYRRVDSAEPLVPPVNVPPGLQEASLAGPIEGFGHQSSSSSDAMMVGAAESSSTAYTSDAPGSAGTSSTSASSTDPVCGPSLIGPMPQGVVWPEIGACSSLATTSTNSGSSSEKGVVIGRRAR